MSAKYTAWNGQPYPWPPPEGWYEASDGRWWAPGYGPDDVGDQETVLNKTGGAVVTAVEATTKTSVAAPADTATESAKKAPAQAAKVAIADAEPIEDDKRSRAPLVAAGAMVAILFASGLGFLAVRDDSTSAALSSTTTIAAGQVTPSTAPPPPQTTLAEPPPTTTEAVSTTTVAQTSSTTTTTQPQTETTVAPPTTAPTTTLPPTTVAATTLPTTATTTPISIVIPDGPFATDAERAAAWQTVLDQAGIDSAALTDADIIAFGNDFCLFATVSDDVAEFDDFRNRALSAIVGDLTESELKIAIDAAVLVFCPGEAERLGISI